MTNKQTFTGDENAVWPRSLAFDKNTVWPVTISLIELWQKQTLTYDKTIATIQAQLRLHPQWRKWLARWAVHTDTQVVGSSLTHAAFFLEKISNSIIVIKVGL